MAFGMTLGGGLATYSGRSIDLLDPNPDDILIEDIAHSLARICRFIGHARGFYSVAQHCCEMVHNIHGVGTPRALLLSALLHDAHEAYVGDVPTPIKRCVRGDYRILDRRFERAVREKFGVPLILPPEVEAADLRMLATERRDLFDFTPEWPGMEGVEPYRHRINPRCPEEAEAEFLELFAEFTL